ncbi:cytosolic leucyl tRNA synthetase [Quaeritorhiza haematococci]|nr:cytosolic leucyl tRNA synthetase [Quaeritorhiza haematococci]
MKTKSSAQPFNYYAVFDVEATCVSDGGWEYPNEIIEFPIVLVDGRTLEVVDEFHRYVRPVINPKLSDFCKELTGITQEDIDKADPFTTVLSEFESWLSKYAKYPFTRRVMFVTDGPWDLRDFARKQCEASLISRPPYWRRWVDVRKLHHGFYDRPQRENIAGMLKHFGMEFEGREHCGLHDARNIARIAIRMMKDGCIFVPNGEMKLSKRKVNKRGQVRFTKASNNSKCLTQDVDSEARESFRERPPRSTQDFTMNFETAHTKLAFPYKKDTLRDLELKMQARWEETRAFESNAPAPGEPVPPKFMVTFPYPYMNGRLHLGHSFSLSKCEFAVGFHRLQGKKVLFPFGFHCTGMPIKACADKLKREIEMFGKNFEKYTPEEETEKEEPKENVDPKAAASVDPTKIKKKHGKVAAKSTKDKYQFQIMLSMGVPKEDIHKFADAKHWLYYFPPLAMQDLKSFGAHVDWRRSFITTDVNPYYDSFIRWQFNKLRSIKPAKIDFGERYTIFSPLDGQPCMDHDRSVGEGVGVQEYTGIKLEVLLDELQKQHESSRDKVKDVPVGKALTSPEFLAKLKGRKVYLVAATLRPETMYGQTNCYVGTDIEYGVYEVDDKQVYVCTERAAKNMAWQSLFPSQEKGKISSLLKVKGWDLVGLPLKAPLAKFPKVYTLPMENVLDTKGTGVVTSVPSDSPDDYITLQDLAKKSAYYNIDLKWVQPYLEPVPIIRTPTYGDLSAKKAVEELKIRSQKDKDQLAKAKELVYKEGFYGGTMLVEEYAGIPVQEAKPLIRAKLIESGDAFIYCEPEGLVISRSNDVCVVTLADQWYMNYGEDSWKEKAVECLKKMETFGSDTRHAFEKTLDWLGQWACSRSYGLGSRLPWDPQYLIESLSDSTIYMAYYTVAHLLQSGALDGSKEGQLKISASEMTDEVWEYIMNDKAPLPKSTKIPTASLETLRREFQYWYPLDLRCSGKDLITNHLTFFIYNHVALFPEHRWPRGVRANGHLLLNNEKMSKSTGNFLTLQQAIDLYGADATRFTLADAGDALEDANYLHLTAESAILRMYSELEWIEETLADADAGKLRSGPYSWIDRVFESEMNKLVSLTEQAYNQMLFREALKQGFYSLQNARNEYRKAATGQGADQGTVAGEKYEGMHVDLIKKFVEVQALVLAPITPHWSEHVWTGLLKKPTSILKATWPKFSEPADEALLAAAAYIRDLVGKIRSAEESANKKKAKKGGAATPQKQEANGDAVAGKRLRLYVALDYPEWQSAAVAALKETYDEATKKFSGKETQILGQKGLLKDKRVMPFVSMLKRLVDQNGSQAFTQKLLFDELETIRHNVDYVRRELSMVRITSVEVVLTVDVKEKGKEGGFSDEDIRKAELATPGQPSYITYLP